MCSNASIETIHRGQAHRSLKDSYPIQKAQSLTREGAQENQMSASHSVLELDDDDIVPEALK